MTHTPTYIQGMTLPPPGFEVEQTERRTYGGGSVKIEREGTGTGAGLATSADNVASTFNGSSPEAGFDRSSGGTTAIEQTLSSESGRGILIVAGIVFFAAAGVAAYLKRFSAAIAAAGVGVACLLVAFYPAVLLWAALGGIVILGVCLFANDATRHRIQEALRATVAGIEDLPDGQRQTVKHAIGSHADAKDEKIISKVKAADQLLTESQRRKARVGV